MLYVKITIVWKNSLCVSVSLSPNYCLAHAIAYFTSRRMQVEQVERYIQFSNKFSTSFRVGLFITSCVSSSKVHAPA